MHKTKHFNTLVKLLTIVLNLRIFLYVIINKNSSKEMEKFTYLYTFISLSITIGVGGLLNNVHQLLRNRNKVSWHWLPLSWTIIVFLILIHIWLSIYDHINNELTETAGGFILLFLPVIFILLASKAVLPDVVLKEGVDLKIWYFKQKNYIIYLLVLNWISFSFLKYFEEDYALTKFHVSKYILMIIPLIIYLILFCTKKVWIHTVVVISILITIIYILTNQRIMH